MNLSELPNRRVEAWKYSDLRRAMEAIDSRVVTRAPLAMSPIEALTRGDADEVNLTIRTSDKVHEILHSFAKPRNGTLARILVPAGEAGVLVEQFRAGSFTAGLTDIDVEEGARLTRIVVQRDMSSAVPPPDLATVVLSEARVKVAAGAEYRQIVLAEGAKLARIETHVAIDGEGAEVELNGVYMCGAGRHADLTSVIEHKVPSGQTRQLIKGVARKGGRGVFQGKIVVEHGAQKTDARQYHHGLLLEEGAEIFAKPELLIHADDVQCAHGNTAGGLDETALFYMRSRGMPERQARALLIEAFLSDAIPADLPAEIDVELRARISAWLGGAP